MCDKISIKNGGIEVYGSTKLQAFKNKFKWYFSTIFKY